MMARACETGHADGCAMLGELLASGVSPSAVGLPEANPIGLFQEACNGGSGMGCARLSETIKVRGRRGTKREQEERLLQRGCDLGYGPACGALARRGMEGAWVQPEAVELLRRGCAQGDGPSCEVLGAHLVGRSNPDDRARGRAGGGRAGVGSM